MTPYTQLQTRLQAEHHTWLVTGVAGFIGSNLQDRQKAMVFCHCGPRPAIHPARHPSIASGKNICQIWLQPAHSMRKQLHNQ